MDEEDEPAVLGLVLFSKLRDSGIPIHHAVIPPLIRAAATIQSSSSSSSRQLLTEDSVVDDINPVEITNLYKKLITFYLSTSWSNQFQSLPLPKNNPQPHGGVGSHTVTRGGGGGDSQQQPPPLFLPTQSILLTSHVYFRTTFNQTEWTCSICSYPIPAIGRMNQTIPLKQFLSPQGSMTSTTTSTSTT